MTNFATSLGPASRSHVWTILLLLLLTGATGSASGQGGGALEDYSQEKVNRAIDLQIGTIARDLGLDDASAGQLKASYRKSRKDLMKEIRNRLDEGVGDNARLMSDVYAMQVEARDKLVAAASGYLTEKQQERVGQTLGSFSLQWDNFILNLNELGLSPEVRARAEDELLEFVIEYGPVRDEGYKNGDLSFVLKGMVLNKQKLDRDLKEILPEQAFALWSKKTELRFGDPRQ